MIVNISALATRELSRVKMGRAGVGVMKLTWPRPPLTLQPLPRHLLGTRDSHRAEAPKALGQHVLPQEPVDPGQGPEGCPLCPVEERPMSSCSCWSCYLNSPVFCRVKGTWLLREIAKW